MCHSGEPSVVAGDTNRVRFRDRSVTMESDKEKKEEDVTLPALGVEQLPALGVEQRTWSEAV